MLLAIDSPATEGVTLTRSTPGSFMSIFSPRQIPLSALAPTTHPNAEITVNPFVDAFTSGTGFTIVPQQGTAHIETLGDKIMTPVVYQNRGGTESLWAVETFVRPELHPANRGSLVSIQCHRRHVSRYPGATANLDQRRRWLWRFMPSIAVDNAVTRPSDMPHRAARPFPGIRYAGRLALTRQITLARAKL